MRKLDVVGWIFRMPNVYWETRQLPHDARDIFYEQRRRPIEPCVFESREGVLENVRQIDDALAFAVANTMEDS